MYNVYAFQRHENLTLAINSAKAIGCVVIGIDSHTLNSVQVFYSTLLIFNWGINNLLFYSRVDHLNMYIF